MPLVLTILGAALLGLLTLQGWALLQLRPQQARFQHRLDDLATRLAVRASGPVAARAAVVPRVDERPVGLLDQLAPPFAALDLDGRTVTLDDLRAAGNPVLLVVTDPRCGPCYELLPDVGGWQRVYGDRLTIALVSGGDPALNRAMTAEYGIHTVLLQMDREVAAAFELGQAPAAVLIRPDGTVGSRPTFGAYAVRALVASTLGLALPAQPVQAIRSIALGDAVPALRRPDLDGRVVDLAAPGAPTLLLFWSPGCTHCHELLPMMKTWPQWPGSPRLVVVTRGPAAFTREIGLAAPAVNDDDRSLAQTFGATGTPAAVLIDAAGIVASEVARGTSGVRALVAERLLPAVMAAA
jgi:thiol-disulfide isomerase/thioredoxin